MRGYGNSKTSRFKVSLKVQGCLTETNKEPDGLSLSLSLSLSFRAIPRPSTPAGESESENPKRKTVRLPSASVNATDEDTGGGLGRYQPAMTYSENKCNF